MILNHINLYTTCIVSHRVHDTYKKRVTHYYNHAQIYTHFKDATNPSITGYVHTYIHKCNSQIMHTIGCVALRSYESRYIAIPGHRILQLLVFCSPNIEPLLSVEEDALGHSLKVAAELAQHIATPLVYYSQMNEPTRSIPVGRHGYDSLSTQKD